MNRQIQAKSQINQVHGKNIYCGPAVLSSITGLSTDEIATRINRNRALPDYYEVTGAYLHELKQVLTDLNFPSQEVPYYSDSSVFNVLSTIKQDGYYIALIGPLRPHFLLLEKKGNNRFLCDNHTKTPMRAEGSARLSQRVLQLLYVKEREKTINIFEEWGIGGY
jgi:hypothetical protein